MSNRHKPKIIFVGSFIDTKIRKEKGGMLVACTYLIESQLNQFVNFIPFDSTNISVPSPPLFIRLLLSIKRVFRFGAVLKKQKPNIALIYSSGGFSFLEKSLLALLCKWRHIPVIISVRSGVFMDQVRSSSVFRLIAKTLLRYPNIILCQGNSWKTFYVNCLGLDESHITVIKNWIDPKKFFMLPSKSERDKKKPYQILFVGWTNKEKGVFELLRAVDELRSDIDIQCDIVGRGNHFNEAQQTIQKKHLESTIVLHGWKDSGELLDFYKNADVLVLPSYGEGFPNVILEAMAAGLPVIATPVGSIPDVIKDGKNGYIVSPKNHIELKQALLKVYNNPKQSAIMGKTNRLQVEKEHTIDNLSEKMFQLFSDLI